MFKLPLGLACYIFAFSSRCQASVILSIVNSPVVRYHFSWKQSKRALFYHHPAISPSTESNKLADDALLGIFVLSDVSIDGNGSILSSTVSLVNVIVDSEDIVANL